MYKLPIYKCVFSVSFIFIVFLFNLNGLCVPCQKGVMTNLNNNFKEIHFKIIKVLQKKKQGNK